jgi:hypothetical protein
MDEKAVHSAKSSNFAKPSRPHRLVTGGSKGLLNGKPFLGEKLKINGNEGSVENED